MAEGKQIALEGEYFVIAAAAYYFIETYVPHNNYNASIPEKVSHYAPIVEKPDNYIMLIGDGMGLNATCLYDTMKNEAAHGDGEDTFYGYFLPYFGYSRTNSLDGVTDSAAGGTALACGIKTHNRYVGQDRDHNAVQSLTELAGSLGMSTAVLSTDATCGATPSTFSAHADDRSFYEDITASQAQLQEKYGTIIDCDYDTFNKWGVGIICDKVTNALNTMAKNPNGCFLMYEEAYVDMNSHKNDMENTFNALIRFNRVIGAVMEYAYYHPNTFVLITADHETGGITLENGKYVYTTTEHTGANVPVFVHGYGGEVFNGKTVENVQIAQTFASFWGVKNFGDQSVYKPLA